MQEIFRITIQSVQCESRPALLILDAAYARGTGLPDPLGSEPEGFILLTGETGETTLIDKLLELLHERTLHSFSTRA